MKRRIDERIERIEYIDKWLDGEVMAVDVGGQEYIVTREYLRGVYAADGEFLRYEIHEDEIDRSTKFKCRAYKLMYKYGIISIVPLAMYVLTKLWC